MIVNFNLKFLKQPHPLTRPTVEKENVNTKRQFNSEYVILGVIGLVTMTPLNHLF